MNTYLASLIPVEVEQTVSIPAADGKSIAYQVTAKLPALRDPNSGEEFLTEEALQELDKIKARHLGVLSPTEIRELRQNLGLSQKRISELLQLGARTWSRWESGHEHPSRSSSILLHALADGRLDVNYLDLLQRPVANVPIKPQTSPGGANTMISYAAESPAPTEPPATCAPF